nr:hypothetical protein [Neorhizobium sp. T7_12]
MTAAPATLSPTASFADRIGHRRKQRLRVGVAGITEDLGAWADLDDAAELHALSIQVPTPASRYPSIFANSISLL